MAGHGECTTTSCFSKLSGAHRQPSFLPYQHRVTSVLHVYWQISGLLSSCVREREASFAQLPSAFCSRSLLYLTSSPAPPDESLPDPQRNHPASFAGVFLDTRSLTCAEKTQVRGAAQTQTRSGLRFCRGEKKNLLVSCVSSYLSSILSKQTKRFTPDMLCAPSVGKEKSV